MTVTANYPTWNPPHERDESKDCAAGRLQVAYAELKAIARGYLRNEAAGHTLQPTALLHEAYLRVLRNFRLDDLTTSEMCAALANSMRYVLVDHARRKKAEKRGGRLVRIDFDESQLPATELSCSDLIDLDEMLVQLEQVNQRHASVVKLRFFSGLTVEETARILDVSPATVKSDWRIARAWLLARLKLNRLQSGLAATTF